jgi:hypothetical protein
MQLETVAMITSLLRHPSVRRRARSIPPKSLKDCYWWLKQTFLAVRDPELREWVLRKWGYKPYQTVDRRKRPLRIKMQFISLRAREREFEIMKLRESNMSFRAIGRALGINHVAAHKRFWCARRACRAEHDRRTNQERSLNRISEEVHSWVSDYQRIAAAAVVPPQKWLLVLTIMVCIDSVEDNLGSPLCDETVGAIWRSESRAATASERNQPSSDTVLPSVEE